MGKRVREKDMIGNKYGRLTVIRATTVDDLIKYGKPVSRRQWLCLCECGNECVVTTGNLKGTTTSCGCLKKDSMTKDDIKAGMMYGNIEILYKTDRKTSNRSSCFMCKCHGCGEMVEISRDSLIKGASTCASCAKVLFAEQYCTTGESNLHYKKHLTDADRKGNRISGMETWRQSVLAKHGNTCTKCGATTNLVAHHLNGYHWDVGHRLDVDNGACLCEGCHHRFHNMYSNRYNTEEQYIAFLLEALKD